MNNSLLASLPAASYRRLLPGLELVTLKSGEVLQKPGVPLRHVYFPIDCVIALLTTVQGRPAVQVVLVGHEGMIGGLWALGGVTSPRLALVQGTGTALRMKSALFRKELLQSKSFQKVFYRYKDALIDRISQTVGCVHFHSTHARLASYLLTTGDYARSDEIRLSQELLARMLGVRRSRISMDASALRKRNLINYNRGTINILDRIGLGAVACVCYRPLGAIARKVRKKKTNFARPRTKVVRGASAGRPRSRSTHA